MNPEKFVIYGLFFSSTNAKKILHVQLKLNGNSFDVYRGWLDENFENELDEHLASRYGDFSSALKGALEILSREENFDVDKIFLEVFNAALIEFGSINFFGNPSKYDDGEVQYILDRLGYTATRLHNPPFMFSVEEINKVLS